MTVIAMLSVKHSPGVTTAALALASAWSDQGDVVVIEADPAGGDVAARTGLGFDPGLLSLAASGRHAGAQLDLGRHGQQLPAGGIVVAAPTAPDRAAPAVAAVASRLAHAVRATAANGIIDCGRWSPASPATAAIAASDLCVLVIEPTLAGVDHAQARADLLAAETEAPLALLLLGERPYRSRDLEGVVGPSILGAIAVDPAGVAALHGGASVGAAGRSPVVRSARTALAKAEVLAASRNEAMA